MNQIDNKIYNKVVKDRMIRSGIVKESFEFFFYLYFDHYIRYKSAKFQKEIMHILSDPSIKNFCLTAFRGSGKSTIVTTAFPIWAILGKLQHKFVLIVCQTKAQAKQHMANLKRELEVESLLKNDLGPFKEVQDEWSAGSIVFSHSKARISVVSTEQSLRGIRHNQHRPSLIICDDLEDLNSVKTTESRDKLYDWFVGDLLPAGDINTKLVLVGNKLHEDSLLMKIRNKLLSNSMLGVYREFPLIDTNGNCLWLEKFSSLEIIENEKNKLGNEVAWQREYLLKIISKDDQIIKNEWIQSYGSEDAKDFVICENGICVDLAISQSPTADFTAIVSASIIRKNDKILIQIHSNPINERLTAFQTIDKILEKDKQFKSDHPNRQRTLFLESNGYQRSLAEYLPKNIYLRVELKNSINSKEERLSSISYLIETGKVIFPKHGCELLINQLLGFGSERHDDLVDALTILLSGLSPKMDRYTVTAKRDHEDDNWGKMNSRQRHMIMERRGHYSPRFDAM